MSRRIGDATGREEREQREGGEKREEKRKRKEEGEKKEGRRRRGEKRQRKTTPGSQDTTIVINTCNTSTSLYTKGSLMETMRSKESNMRAKKMETRKEQLTITSLFEQFKKLETNTL